MHTRRFPWTPLVLLWAGLSIFLITLCWKTAVTLDFRDPDDFMRLQQVRDYLNGQSWYDLTQYRIAPPRGLAMHWSRLVDVPILLFLMPLRPVVGQHLAEVVAVIGAPMLTMLALMAAVIAMTRRLLGPDIPTSLLACVVALCAPMVCLQIMPARIDHHGWQIVFATAAVAALLHPRPRLSGIIAGLALASYLNISIEGAPLAAGVIGVVGMLWAFGRDERTRLTGVTGALAAGTIILFGLTMPGYRWTEGYCDAVMPSHVATFAVVAIGTVIAVEVGATRRWPVRIALLCAVAAAAIAVFGMAAPTCLGSPFGTFDKVVDMYWYKTVSEGMPLWRLGLADAVSAVGFPIIVGGGIMIGWMRATSAEMRRRWTIMLALFGVSLVTAALVHRAAGVTHVLAVPGALVLIGMAVRYVQRFIMPVRAVASAIAIFALSPIMPIFAVASTEADDAAVKHLAGDCDRRCALQKIAAIPAELMLTSTDLGAIVVGSTPHSTFDAGYHRLQTPLRETILFFLGSPENGQAFVRAHGFHHIVIAPGDGETGLFIRHAPHGMMARLMKVPLPDWLVEENLGSSAVRLYRVRR